MKKIVYLLFVIPLLTFSQIGINTDTPSAVLDIVGDGANIVELNNSTNTNLITINNNGAISFNGGFGIAGQVLSSNGSSATPTWTTLYNAWNIIDDLQISEEQANPTTTFTNVTGLEQILTVGVVYEIEAVVIYNSQATTTGVKLSFGGGTPTIYSGKIDIPISTTSATVKHYAAPNTEATNTSSSRINNNYAYMRFIFQPNTTGNHSVRFASEVAGSSITIKRGSSLKIRILQ